MNAKETVLDFLAELEMKCNPTIQNITKDNVEQFINKSREEPIRFTLHSLFVNDYCNESLYNNNESYQDSLKRIYSKLDFEHIESEGGVEGGAEYCRGVIRIKDQFFVADWHYYSYHGCEISEILESICEVFPRKVEVTIYE